jgi:hypothetical protein
MFDIAYDAKHSVLLSRFFGTYSPADITLRDNAVRRFVAKNGLVRGLMDFSAVTAIDVPLDLLIQRAHQPGILTGHQRVIVAPTEPSYSFNRLVAAHQLFARKTEPVLVRSIGEAYDSLGIVNPAFSAVDMDRYRRILDAVLHNVLDRLAEAVRAHSIDDPVAAPTLQGVASGPDLRPLAGLITLSDVFNAALHTKALRDPLIRAVCRDCRAGLPLHCMSISPGRVTTYSCPICNGWILKLSQVDETVPGDASGYMLGRFEMLSRAALDILGVYVPETET